MNEVGQESAQQAQATIQNHAVTSVRFGGVDVAGVRVRRAEAASDWDLVAAIRQSAYSRLDRGLVPQRREWVDDADRDAAAISLIGHAPDGKPLASLRIQDGRQRPVELRQHVPLDLLIATTEAPYAQFARLAALRAPDSMSVMFGLFKAAWGWCLAQGLQTIVIATPPWTRPIYDYLMFRDLGPQGVFHHPFSKRAQHASMTLSVPGAEPLWRSAGHPLCGQFFDQDHPALRFWCPPCRSQ